MCCATPFWTRLDAPHLAQAQVFHPEVSLLTAQEINLGVRRMHLLRVLGQTSPRPPGQSQVLLQLGCRLRSLTRLHKEEEELRSRHFHEALQGISP